MKLSNEESMKIFGSTLDIPVISDLYPWSMDQIKSSIDNTLLNLGQKITFCSLLKLDAESEKYCDRLISKRNRLELRDKLDIEVVESGEWEKPSYEDLINRTLHYTNKDILLSYFTKLEEDISSYIDDLSTRSNL